MSTSNRLLLAFTLVLCACSGAPPRTGGDAYGVLVMAHGGGAEWNRAVEECVAPLAHEQPLEIAFGMADALSLQDAASRLEARGVQRIGVVRLFVSGESWHERTRQILGLERGAPEPPIPVVEACAPAADHASGHSGHSMEFWRIASSACFAVSLPGLLDEPGMGAVLADRARGLSRDPRLEDVLVLAHGPGDEGENERWLARLDALCAPVRAALPFRRVAAMTLREDWPEKRAEAERRIRAYVERATGEGGRALVIPFRVQGFGPYAEILAGLEYGADGRGLLPHPAVGAWIAARARELRAGPFERRSAR